MTPEHVVIQVPAGEARDIFVVSDTPARRAWRNRGPGDATFAVGADATANSTALYAGERRAPRYRTRLKISAFSAAGTTIEGESWS